MTKSEIVNIRLSKDEKRHLIKLAEKKRMTLADLVRYKFGMQLENKRSKSIGKAN